ncbi:tyrosine-type recombinase/integrase [Polaribacter sp. IC073]|uniref:tyrosine-type recombinase/integrase n=1 Tax=Polaribacter sp. IC073 TaxID=2508540 RepID=UPI0011BD6CBA|nr:phage integrase SAM-like domain-containing protein [Polaribacter sp. IC073]TXD47732.1 integrase [Polaribacter sp. IC073]
MATINFLYRSTKEKAPLTLRLLHRQQGKDFVFSSKTEYKVEKNYWKLHNTNSRSPEIINKQADINADLKPIREYIINKFDETKFNLISNDWLKEQIYNFKHPIEEEDKQSDLLIDAVQSIIDEAPTRKNSKGGIGLSKSRVNAYTSLKNMLTVYQKQKTFKVKDVDVKFAKDFLKYLLNTKNYQKSYALKKIADLKTVCNDASFYGVETSLQLKKIDSTKTKNENILYLSNKELQQIEDVILLSESLKNARKWLLLGCNIGQRGGDLLLLDETNFINRSGLEVIELKQQKTDKNVTIPVLEKTKDIIKSGLPYKISIQKLNKHIKEICKIAEINELIKDSKITVTEKGKGNKEKRKVSGIYPKWELMASHVCRRSFCTNLYGILPTPLIMSISAHSSEKMLLNYIGKDSLDFAQQIADFYTLQALKEKKEPQLQVIKNASNQ